MNADSAPADWPQPADNAQELLKQGVELRNGGDRDRAEALLKAARDASPSSVQPYYELGILYQNIGQKELAISEFSSAFERDNSDPRIVQCLAANIATLGDVKRAIEVLRRARMLTREMVELLPVVAHYARFVTDFPIARVRQLFSDKSNKLTTAHLALERIAQACEAKQPFAMIRFGDGEGTWLHRSATEELEYGALYERNRQQFWNVWFGEAQAAQQPRFHIALSALRHEAKAADIFGTAWLSWVEHEYRTANLRGCSGTLNSFRTATAVKSPEAMLANNTLHYDLDKSGLLDKVLRDNRKVGVFSCHPSIVNLMKSRFGLEDVTYFPVPGEPSRRHLHGEGTYSGNHFPDIFEENLRRIETTDVKGMVVLVAGGILGKLYALRLKKAGAIALDIGSVADKWMGKKTRPGF